MVYRRLSLKGKTVAITRSKEEAEEFARLVESEGGEAIALAAIKVVPDRLEVARLVGLLEDNREKCDYCAFMSAKGVRAVFELGGGGSADRIRRALDKVQVIAVGPKTAQELERAGVRVAHVPEVHSSIGLVRMMEAMGPAAVAGRRIVIPRSAAADDYAAEGLGRLGMKVEEVFVYRTLTAARTPAWDRFARLLKAKKVAAIVFTSASNVRAFFELLPDADLRGVQVVSIGPFTSKELDKWQQQQQQHRCKIDYVESDEHTVEGAFRFLAFTGRRQRRG